MLIKENKPECYFIGIGKGDPYYEENYIILLCRYVDQHARSENGCSRKGSDVILLGPQVRYALKSVQDRYPQIPVASIDMRAYGMMDGKAVLKIAEDKMK